MFLLVLLLPWIDLSLRIGCGACPFCSSACALVLEMALRLSAHCLCSPSRFDAFP